MLQQIITAIQQDVTMPRIIVALIFGGIVRIFYKLTERAEDDVKRFTRTLQNQHRQLKHGADFHVCTDGNCGAVDVSPRTRLTGLRRVS